MKKQASFDDYKRLRLLKTFPLNGQFGDSTTKPAVNNLTSLQRVPKMEDFQIWMLQEK